MSKLLASLQEFKSRFDTFETNRLRVGQIYDETRVRWLDKRQNDKRSARSQKDSPRSELPSTPDEGNPHHALSVSLADGQFSFESEMSVVVRLLKEKPTLVFVGRLKSGKSTLANVILQHYILPADQGPCTARMVKLKPITEGSGDSNAYLQVLKADGTTRIGEPLTLETVVDSRGLHRLRIPQNVVDVGRGTSFEERSRKFRDDKGQETEHGAWVEIFHPHPLLQFIQIVDSPGKGENDSLDQLVNDEICSGLVQTLVYVIDGCRGLTTKVYKLAALTHGCSLKASSNNTFVVSYRTGRI